MISRFILTTILFVTISQESAGSSLRVSVSSAFSGTPQCGDNGTSFASAVYPDGAAAVPEPNTELTAMIGCLVLLVLTISRATVFVRPRISVRNLVILGVVMAGSANIAGASSISAFACAAGSCNSSVNSTALVTKLASGSDFSASANAIVNSMGSFGVMENVSGNAHDGQVIANSTASAADRLLFSGISGGSIELTFAVDATTLFDIVTTCRASTSCANPLSRAELYVDTADQQVVLFRAGGASGGLPDIPLASSITIVESLGSNPFFDYRLSLSPQINGGYGVGFPVFTGSADVDALNTLTLTQLRLFDSAGNFVSDPSYTSESGFAYPFSSSVPEPAPAVFTAAGLVFLICVAARRRTGCRI